MATSDGLLDGLFEAIVLGGAVGGTVRLLLLDGDLVLLEECLLASGEEGWRVRSGVLDLERE